MSSPKFINQPSIRVMRKPGETTADFIDRILNDPRLLPDQQLTLQQDSRPSAFDDCLQAIWIEQAPRPVPQHGAVE